MSPEAAIQEYVKNVEQAYRAGNATEHTYRPYLKTLLESLVRGITAVNEPKRVACGAPDYAITRADPSGPITVGWVEAKDIGVSLDETERTDQLKNRYLPNLPNLVLTDYVEFRWYVDGKLRLRARLGALGAGRKLTWDADGARAVGDLLTAMLGQQAPRITSADDLARRMARMAHMIKNVAFETLHSDAPEGRTAREALADLREAFKTTLIPDLTDEAFTDMFAQTLAYGMFAARYNHTGPQPFTAQDAVREIPHSNPFLRRLFATIEGPDLADAPYSGFVEDLARVLAGADMAVILRDFGKRTRTEDPIVHFYEPFLQAYDPKLRELRGVYYTPDPVVSYITRSVDAILKRDFAASDGLADGQVMLLDPACGTGTFLSRVVSRIRDRFMASNNAGAWPGYVRERLLPRVFGFELLMAPYAMAHLRLGMQLAGLDLPEGDRDRWGVRAGENERLGVYLTNTLEEAAFHSNLLMGKYISDEANAAARVKRDAPVMVVLGNPPYSGTSANNGRWISALLRGEDLTGTQGETLRERGKGIPTANYFMVDGDPLGERNPKWLNDDYVKFIRFAQWRIERTGHGVLAFITNHGYLDNPTFRGMRQSLMQSFDDIYLLDLHGNSKKKERDPEGGADVNVFDIQQGVAIGIFIRRRGAQRLRSARIHHAHLYGERQHKYDWLEAHDQTNTAWTDVQPQSPFYLFIPQDRALEAEYGAYWRITDVLPVNVLGFQTHRDAFAIDFDERALRQRITEMRDTRASDQQFAEKYELTDNRDWQLAKARQALRNDANWESHLVRCLYRPFDWRASYFDEVAMDYPRRELRQHVAGRRNPCLLTSRQTATLGYRHAWVADVVANDCAISTTSREANQVFPLYLYPNGNVKDLWASSETASNAPGGRRANLAPAFITALTGRLGMAWVADGRGDRVATVGPEDVFSYLYAIFSAPSYRARYAEFLKSDFPRAPLTSDADLFRALCGLGDQLTGDHLLERALPAIVGYPVGGDNRVEAVRYVAPDAAQGRKGRVYINNDQYFEGVAPDVWAFHVGGYQVAEKWLKDRKNRTLSYTDIEHYGKTVAALADTLRLMAAIDEVIEDHGGWPLDGAAGSGDVARPATVARRRG